MSRWPLAGNPYAIPMRAGKAPTTEGQQALHDIVYLEELIRQGDIFSASFLAAMDAALVRSDAAECWRHLQSAMFAAIVIYRLVDASGARRAHKAAALARAERLRTMCGMDTAGGRASAIFKVTGIRDAMEHIDERLDRVTRQSGGAGISD